MGWKKEYSAVVGPVIMISKQNMTKVEDISTSAVDSQEDLIEMAKEAAEFLQWHRWCKTLQQGYLVQGWAGVLGIFYFEFVPASAAVDDRLWVIVGDVPPAYIDCVNSPNAVSALEDYLYVMQEWVDHVKAGHSVEKLVPVYRRHSFVRVNPSIVYAELLETRLQFIREKIVSDISSEAS